MSAHADEIQNVESMTEFVRDMYVRVQRVDHDIHAGMNALRFRLAGLLMAEDPEVQADTAALAAGKIDFAAAEDPHEFAAKIRAASGV